ncbi:MAG: ABC transporter permease [Blastocatellales bacterium]|nr:ABC transporter permease [Blastocatellales bacterium]
MNLTDILALALRNLRQAKLRTALTVIGVVIGVAAIITMVSFGIGLQQNIISNAFAKLDLFTVITVFGANTDELIALDDTMNNPSNVPSNNADAPSNNAEDDSGDDPSDAPQGESSPDASPTPDLRRRRLDDAAIAEMAAINGVRYALPVLMFQSYVRYEGRTERQRIGGALASVDYNPRFKNFLAGGSFTNDDAREVIVTENFLDRVAARRNQGPFSPAPLKSDEQRAEDAAAALGREITLLTLPSAAGPEPTSVFGIPLGLLEAGEQESGPDGRYETHVFRIRGVLPSDGGVNFDQFARTDLYIPVEQARRFRQANRDPLELMSEALIGDAGYQRAEVRVMDPTVVRDVQREITKLGFRSFSLTNQIDEIRYIFFVVNGGLALLGGIALLVASFGIANTMIMSILERTREIGIMKAIGGSDGEIMRIFFFEASLIGLLGGAFGVLAGWGTDRLANFLVNRYVVKQGPYIEFFSIPWYLWLGAIAFAVLISLAAAVYPALRAARVDPIRALRHD